MTKKLIRSVSIMLFGLVLVFLTADAVGWFIRLVGAAFFLPALVSIINLYVSRAESKMISKVLISIINVGCMAFGIWLMADPDYFQVVFVKLLAVMLLAFAVYQVVVMMAAQRHTVIPVYLYIAPLLLVVSAVLLFAVEFSSLSTVAVIFGLSAVVAGISDLLITLTLKDADSKKLESSKGGAVQKY
ncbi:MAG: DUF308 domain-containing protein [Bacteroidaceae bacterium]|nr:DUF308 domain-containing protein [Bacteroidaceae bacterium]